MPRWVIPLIAIDVVFLPFPHLGPIPLKASYLVVGFFALLIVRQGRLDRYIPRILVAGFGLLILATMVGYLVFLISGGSAFSETARNLLVFTLAPLAFIVGAADRRERHNYVPWLLVLYLFVTTTFTIYATELEWIAELYGLRERVATGIYSVRSQGLHYNANISALFASLLVLFLYAGIKYGFVRARPWIVVAAVVAGGGVVLMLISRNQIVAFSILALLILWSAAPQHRFRWTTALVAVLVALVVFAAPLGGLLANTLGYDPIEKVNRASRALTDTSRPKESILRPVADIGWALDRWQFSPIVGTGFDSVETEQLDLSGVAYHNDWLSVIVSSGLIGLAVFAVIVAVIARIDIALALPFVLPGATNAFIFAPSHFILFMVIAGLVWSRKRSAISSAEASVARRYLPAR